MAMTPLQAARMYRGLPRSIHVLFFARVVNSAGAFVIPFLTLFLTQKIGITADAAGRFMLLLAVAHVPGALLGGRLADRVGRKLVLLLGQALAGAFLLPGVFLGNSMVVAWSIVAAQFFSALATPCSQAMVTDLTNPQTRPAAFSLLYLGYNLGMAVGPMLAGFLFEHLIWMLFLVDAVTTFVAVALVALFVPDTTPTAAEIAESDASGSGEHSVEGGALRALLKRPALIFFTAVVAVMAFIYAQQGFALPLQLKAVFAGRGELFYGTLLTVNAVVVIAVTGPIVAATRNNAPAANLLIAAAAYIVGFGVIALIRALPLFIISTMVWTLGEILVTTNMNVYLANHTPVSHRGRFNAIIPLISGGGQAISPALVGIWIGVAGLTAVWPALAVLGLLAAAGFSALLVMERRPARETPRSSALPD